MEMHYNPPPPYIRKTPASRSPKKQVLFDATCLFDRWQEQGRGQSKISRQTHPAAGNATSSKNRSRMKPLVDDSKRAMVIIQNLKRRIDRPPVRRFRVTESKHYMGRQVTHSREGTSCRPPLPVRTGLRPPSIHSAIAAADRRTNAPSLTGAGNCLAGCIAGIAI
jgi:hypothetical protein